jgi:hypothetical protein
MAIWTRRRRRRIYVEEWVVMPRPFSVTREADPFGDIGTPPYDAVPNLTEAGELPDLFSDLLVDIDIDDVAKDSDQALVTDDAARTTKLVAEPVI